MAENTSKNKLWLGLGLVVVLAAAYFISQRGSAPQNEVVVEQAEVQEDPPVEAAAPEAVAPESETSESEEGQPVEQETPAAASPDGETEE